MSQMAPEGLPDEGESVDVQAEGSWTEGVYTIRWGLPGSIAFEVHYKQGEEILIPAMLEILGQSWEGIHESTVEAIENRVLQNREEADRG